MDKPTEQELRKLYLEDLRSVHSIGKMFKRSDGTIKTLLLEYGIKVRTQSQQQRIFNARVNGVDLNAIDDGIIEGQFDITQSEAQPSDGDSRPSLLPAPLPLASLADESAYSRLSSKQQKAIELMSDIDNTYTTIEIANLVGVSDETILRWKKNEDFQQALDEATKPGFISEIKMLSRKDLIKRFRTGVGLDKDTREMAFKLTGDLNMNPFQQTNVQVNIKGNW